MQLSMTMSSPLTTIADIGKHEGHTVTLRGWLYNLRESGKLLFPIFRDREELPVSSDLSSNINDALRDWVTNVFCPRMPSLLRFSTR